VRGQPGDHLDRIFSLDQTGALAREAAAGGIREGQELQDQGHSRCGEWVRGRPVCEKKKRAFTSPENAGKGKLGADWGAATMDP